MPLQILSLLDKIIELEKDSSNVNGNSPTSIFVQSKIRKYIRKCYCQIKKNYDPIYFTTEQFISDKRSIISNGPEKNKPCLIETCPKIIFDNKHARHSNQIHLVSGVQPSNNYQLETEPKHIKKTNSGFSSRNKPYWLDLNIKEYYEAIANKFLLKYTFDINSEVIAIMKRHCINTETRRPFQILFCYFEIYKYLKNYVKIKNLRSIKKKLKKSKRFTDNENRHSKGTHQFVKVQTRHKNVHIKNINKIIDSGVTKLFNKNTHMFKKENNRHHIETNLFFCKCVIQNAKENSSSKDSGNTRVADIVYCRVCKREIARKMMVFHLKASKHMKKSKKSSYSSEIYDFGLHHPSKDVYSFLLSLFNKIKTLLNRIHKENKKIYKKDVGMGVGEKTTPIPVDYGYACLICDQSFKKRIQYQKHFMEFTHVCKLKEYGVENPELFIGIYTTRGLFKMLEIDKYNRMSDISEKTNNYTD